MEKRRERIEAWRAERKKKEQPVEQKEIPKAKGWSLEDDDEDEEVSEEKDEHKGENNDADVSEISLPPLMVYAII